MFAFHFILDFDKSMKAALHNYCNCNNYDILQNSFLHTNEMLFILRYGKVAFQKSKQASLKSYIVYLFYCGVLVKDHGWIKWW